MGELERVKNAKRRREEFLEKVTVLADGEVADEDSVKKTSKNDDIKIDDDEMTFDGRAAGSGINESERKRTWQEIDGQDSASKSKKEKHEIDKDGDVDMGAMEEDEWGKWEYDEDHDGEFDPKLLKEARLEEVNFMQNIGRVGAVDLGGVHAEDGQGSHYHHVGRRRQGPRQGGTD